MTKMDMGGVGVEFEPSCQILKNSFSSIPGKYHMKWKMRYVIEFLHDAIISTVEGKKNGSLLLAQIFTSTACMIIITNKNSEI